MGQDQEFNAEELFKSIYEESPIGIELYDSNGKLIDLNQSCLELFGVSSKEEVNGFDLLDDPNIPKEYLTKLKQRETIRFESTFDFELVKHKNLYKTTKSGKIYLADWGHRCHKVRATVWKRYYRKPPMAGNKMGWIL